MIRRLGIVLVAGTALAACATALSGCSDDVGAPRDVRELELPSASELEIEESLRDGEYFLRAGREGRAEELLRRVLELDPTHLRAQYLLATALIAQAKYDEAEVALRAVLDRDPKYLQAYDMLAKTFESRGLFEEALPVFQAWTAADKSSDDAWFGLGRVQQGLLDYEAAAESLRTAQQLRAARADVRSELGLVLQALGKLDKAEEKQRDAIEREPDYAIAWTRLGVVVFERDPSRADEAIAALRRAIELQRRELGAYLYLYRALTITSETRGEPQLALEARSVMSTLLTLHERDQLRGGGLDGSARGGDGGGRGGDRAQEAKEQQLREAVRAAPGEPGPHQQLAFFLHRTGRAALAIAEYDAALAVTPDDATLLALSGTARLAHGAYTEARTHLTRATELDPSIQLAWRNLAWLRLRLDDPQAALTAYESALGLDPSDLRALKGRGLARMMLGELDAGLRDIANAGWL